MARVRAAPSRARALFGGISGSHRFAGNAFCRACSRAAFRLIHYSIQDDHAHLLVEAKGAAGLGRGMKRLAGLFAFAVNRAIGRGRTGKVLADRYHHEVLTSPRRVRNALAYVLLNARRTRRSGSRASASWGRP